MLDFTRSAITLWINEIADMRRVHREQLSVLEESARQQQQEQQQQGAEGAQLPASGGKGRKGKERNGMENGKGEEGMGSKGKGSVAVPSFEGGLAVSKSAYMCSRVSAGGQGTLVAVIHGPSQAGTALRPSPSVSSMRTGRGARPQAAGRSAYIPMLEGAVICYERCSASLGHWCERVDVCWCAQAEVVALKLRAGAHGCSVARCICCCLRYPSLGVHWCAHVDVCWCAEAEVAALGLQAGAHACSVARYICCCALYASLGSLVCAGGGGGPEAAGSGPQE
eukprot:1154551-Pelagomonas_calceolata.AAC.3